jgi:hypothetical protein
MTGTFRSLTGSSQKTSKTSPPNEARREVRSPSVNLDEGVNGNEFERNRKATHVQEEHSDEDYVRAT